MGKDNRILIVDDELNVRLLLSEVVRKAGYESFHAENGLEGVEKCRLIHPSVVLMDLRMPVMEGMDAFAIMHAETPEIPVVLLTAFGNVDIAVEAMRRGAFDYLVKPANVAEVRTVIERAMTVKRQKEEQSAHTFERETGKSTTAIVGKSAIMQNMFKTVGRVAQTNATVLITGESGSGKELIAKAIHANSPRKEGPFVRINCGAMPEGLMESELFGHEKGSFTGALSTKIGRFELGHSGTLFLDEVGELTLALQVKILRALQDKEFERVGGNSTLHVDVRIIAATNRNLEEMVDQGKFREDLYYRLNVVPIHVPPLRERTEDIPLLIAHFVDLCSQTTDCAEPLITQEARDLLQRYSWPGNVRELANMLERAVIMSNGVIDVADLPGIKNVVPVSSVSTGGQEVVTIPFTGSLREMSHALEREIIIRSLKKNSGNRLKTAIALDISRRALLYKLEEYGLGAHRDKENNEPS